jgi:hypothetical protein
MTNDLQVENAQVSSVPETLPIDEVMDAINRDSQQQPRKYLDETTAQFGGE